MVKAWADRKTIVAGLLVLAALVSLYLSLGRMSSTVPETRDDAPLEAKAAEDVPRIGLDRLTSPRQERHLGKRDIFEYGPPPAPPAPPAPPPTMAVAPQPAVPLAPPGPPPVPPLKVTFIGAVQVRKGVWVASLVTDKDEILTGKAGDVVANRIQILKVGLESVDIQDVGSGRQQRLALGKGN